MASPKSKLQQSWDDEAKMTVLFSPMRDRDLNPKSWEQKVNFWTEVILSDCTECGQAIIDAESLRSQYKRKGKSPSCLNKILEEMLRNKQIQKVSDITQMNNTGWLTWGYNRLVKAPVGWGMKLLPWQSAEADTKPEQYVMMDVIKDKAGKLLDRHFQDEDHLDILDYEDLQQQSLDLCPSEMEFTLVMQQLTQQRQVIVQETDNKVRLVKFLKTDGRKKNIEKIDDQEMRIHKIRQSHVAVKKQIEKLSVDVSSLAEEALAAKKQGAQKNALRLMKKRAITQHRIEQLSGSQDMLENILYRIQQAGSSEMILRAIEGGNVILKELTSKASGDVTNVMDELAELQEDQDEVTSVINTTLPAGVDEPSQEELESELEDLLKEDSPKVKVKETSREQIREHKLSPKKIGFTAISDDDQDSLNADDLNTDLSALLDDLQHLDVPSHSPGYQSSTRTASNKKKQAVQS